MNTVPSLILLYLAYLYVLICAVANTSNPLTAQEALKAEPLMTCGRRPRFIRATTRKPRTSKKPIRLRPKITRRPKIFSHQSLSNDVTMRTDVFFEPIRAIEPIKHMETIRPIAPIELGLSTELDLIKQIYSFILDVGRFYRDAEEDRNRILESRKVFKFSNTSDISDSGNMEDSSNDRIIAHVAGGREAVPGQFPSYVKLGYGPFDITTVGSDCAGTLVGPKTVIGAAHCIQNLHRLDYLTVIVGSNSPGRSKLRSYNVERLCHMDEFCNLKEGSTYLPLFDMMVLELTENVEYNEYVQPACLPYGVDPMLNSNDGDQFETVGLGFMNNHYGMPEKLLFTRMHRKCISEDIMRYKNLGAPIQCYVGIRGSHTCHGDSGGPLYYERRHRGTGEKRQFLAGIVSFGVDTCSVKPGTEGFFADIEGFENYIPKMIQKCVSRIDGPRTCSNIHKVDIKEHHLKNRTQLTRPTTEGSHVKRNPLNILNQFGGKESKQTQVKQPKYL